MKAHTVLSCVLVLVPLTASRGTSMNSQDLQNNSREPASNSTKAAQVSEREQNGLRGPVKACVEERTYPGMRSDDGTQIGELKIWVKTEYDEEGRIAVRRSPRLLAGTALKALSGLRGISTVLPARFLELRREKGRASVRDRLSLRRPGKIAEYYRQQKA
jgi:hypothetical protein